MESGMVTSADSSSTFVLDWHNGLGLGLSVLVAFISGPGGQGGGSFYIPLFSVLLGFTVNNAAALSSAVVFFGCITMVAQAVVTNHPDVPTLPVVDYALVLAMTPILCLGLALGVLVNAVISQWLLNILVILVWTWSCIQLSFTYKKARAKERQQQADKEQQLEREKEKKKAIAAAVAVEDGGTGRQGSKAGPAQRVEAVADDDLATAATDRHHQQQLSGMKQRVAGNMLTKLQFWVLCQPWKLLSIIAFMFAFFITMQAIRGTVTPQCSVGYWTVIALLCAVSLLAGMVVALWLMHKTRQLSSAQTKLPMVNTASPMPGAHAAIAAGGAVPNTITREPAACEGGPSRDIYGSVVQYTLTRILTLNVQMFIAGLMLAVWPLSPIIMALPGMHPQVAAGTSKVMLFLITGGSALSFLAHSQLNITYMLAYGLTNALATPLGVWVADKIIKRTGRPSILLMLTIVRLALCVVVQLVFEAVPRLVALAHGLPRAGFMPEPFCPG